MRVHFRVRVKSVLERVGVGVEGLCTGSKTPPTVFFFLPPLSSLCDSPRRAKRSLPRSLAISGLSDPGSGQLKRLPHPVCTCTPKLQSCGKQSRGSRGAEELRLRPSPEAFPEGEGAPAPRRGGGSGGEEGVEGRPGRGGEVEGQLLGEVRHKVAPCCPLPRLRGRTRQPMAAQRCTADGV